MNAELPPLKNGAHNSGNASTIDRVNPFKQCCDKYGVQLQEWEDT